MAGEHLTTAQKVFRFFYTCHLPAMYTYNQQADDLYGRMSTGDEDYDKELAESTMYTQLNIWQIATHFVNGVPVGLQNPKEAVEIYEVVRDLINEWARRIQSDVNLNDYPRDQLHVLEAFAKEIWTWAEVMKPKDLMEVGISLDLAMANRRRASEGFFKTANVREEQKADHTVQDAIKVNEQAWDAAQKERAAELAAEPPSMAQAMVPVGPSIRQQPLEENRYQQTMVTRSDDDEDDECTWG